MENETYYIVIREQDTIYKKHTTQKEAELEANRLSAEHIGCAFHVLGVLSHTMAAVPDAPKPILTKLFSTKAVKGK